jgi:hypothetical protein
MEIIAALIIACSNLIQPYGAKDGSKADHVYVMDLKKACIVRVSKCAEETLNSNGMTTNVRQLKCSKEVY